MASNTRRGKIPYKTTGIGPYTDEIYSLGGFFGEWAHMYRRHNLAHPLRWSDDRLIYNGLDPAPLIAPDQADPRGVPLTLLEGPDVSVSLSRRNAPMPFCEKNVDRHQIRFYHRGSFTLETELGRLEIDPGDFVVIPRGLIYREIPRSSEDNFVYVFETDKTIQLAETLWDSVGYASLLVDYSEMVLPEPLLDASESDASDTSDETHGGAGEYELRVRYDGEWHSMTYDFDPCHDVIGWVGDPVIFKMNVWNVPTSATSHGHLPPPSGAVLWGEERNFFFNVLGLPPSPNVPPPDGSFGAPSHLNDYDEMWLTHASELAPHIEGHLWLLPRTVPHPGLKRPTGPPPSDKRRREIRINFDTKSPLTWTAEARAALFDDPILAKYTSFFGLPAKAIPEPLRSRAARSDAEPQ